MIELLTEHFMHVYIGSMGLALIAYGNRLRSNRDRSNDRSHTRLPE